MGRPNVRSDGLIYVTGLPSAGTRLAARLLDASPDLEVSHDPHHGNRPLNGPAVHVTRHEPARRESELARWPDGFPDLNPIPQDVTLTVAYEDIVTDPAQVIARAAAHFGVEPWEFNEPVYDANTEPGSRCGPYME